MNRTDAVFNQILRDAQTDLNILAFWLSGSRGKGLSTAHSDYDCTMIVTADVLEEYRRKYENLGIIDIELSVSTFDLFRQYAAWGSPEAWDRYSFAHLKALVDKTGEAKALIHEKGCVPPREIPELIHRALDHYLNQVYRAIKCARDGHRVGARLEAAEQIHPLLEAVFALNGRLRPYYKYLEWELKMNPIAKLGIVPDDFLSALLEILTSGDIGTQQVLLCHIEKLFRIEGYGAVFDEWGQKLTWMKQYRLVA